MRQIDLMHFQQFGACKNSFATKLEIKEIPGELKTVRGN